MPAPLPPVDRAALDAEAERLFGWIEAELSGRVVGAERQARWRPAWYLELERGTERLPLYFRGERREGGTYPLEREARTFEVLEAEGIPVPHIHGLCPDPRGIVMERSPGRADLSTSSDLAEREAVLDHYMEILARVHALDTAPFEAIGIEAPRSAEALGLGDFEVWEKIYRAAKARPEPFIEFANRWVRRNAPSGRRRACFLTGDSGQFLFEKGRVTALLDLELAYIGDAAADLAALRVRDTSEPLGDLRRALLHYAASGGEAVDTRVVHYHTARFALCTPMAVCGLVAAPHPSLNPVQYLAWYWVVGRLALEAIAHLAGTEIEAPPLPDPEPTRHSALHDALVTSLGGEGPAERYETDVSLRMAQVLARADRHGAALEADDLAEAGALLGTTPRSWREADAALERLVTSAGPERDGELARYFVRRCLRQEALLGPALRELERTVLQPID